MGSIKRGIESLKTGIRIHFTFKGKRHKPFKHLGRKPTKADLKYYEAYRGEICRKITDGSFDFFAEFPDYEPAKEFAKASPVLVSTFAANWLEDIRPAVELSTYKGYQKIVDGWIIPKLGHVPIGSLTDTDIKRVIKAETCTDKTLRNKLSPLRSMLEDALDDKFILINPLSQLADIKTIRKKRRLIKSGNKKIDPFTPEEVALLCAGPYAHLVKFAAWSGLRPQEYIALEWSDIDFTNRIVHIQKSVVLGQEKGTKTEAGNREVIMLDGAYDALQEQLKVTRWNKSKVFLNPDGLPWTGSEQVRKRAWIPLVKSAGVRYRKLYNLRHTYASTLLTLGEDIEHISKQMGHTDSVLFRRTYAEIIDGLDVRFGSKANEFYKGLAI